MASIEVMSNVGLKGNWGNLLKHHLKLGRNLIYPYWLRYKCDNNYRVLINSDISIFFIRMNTKMHQEALDVT